MYDLIIIGSGPAGISAAIYASRAKLKFLVLTQNVGSFSNFIDDAKAYPKLSYISGYDLMRRLIVQMKRQGITPFEGKKTLSVEETESGFSVSTDGENYGCKALIVASGRRSRRLGIKGERELDGKGVSFCAICDGELYENRTVAIIGGGHSGLSASSYMLEHASKIYLIERGKSLENSPRVSEEAKRISRDKKIDIMTETEPLEILGSSAVKGLTVRHLGKQRTLDVDAVFIEIGYQPNTEFISGIVKMNGKGEIIIDKNCATSRKGIFAAGDVTDSPVKQILAALGDGAKAAYSAIEYLSSNTAP